MSFPLSPVDKQQYTNALGTRYDYDSTRTAWVITGQLVTGGTGLQGLQGVTGLSLQGVTGVMGIDGVTGIMGIDGVTGLIGVTGIAGTAGGSITGIAGYMAKFYDGTSVVPSTMYNYVGKGVELNVGNAIDASSYLIVKGNSQKLAELGRSNVSGSGSGELNLYTEGVLYTYFNPSTATVGSDTNVTGTLRVGAVTAQSGPAMQVGQSITPGSIGPGMLYNVGPITADCTRAPSPACTIHISDVIRADRSAEITLYNVGTVEAAQMVFAARGFVWQIAADSAGYTDYVDFVCYGSGGSQYITHLHTTGDTASAKDASRLNVYVTAPVFIGDVFYDSATLKVQSHIGSDATGLIGYDIKMWIQHA